MYSIVRRVNALMFCFLMVHFLLPATMEAGNVKKQIDFDYHLDWNEKGYLEVRLNYVPLHKDADTLYYGAVEYGGQKDIFGCIKNLKVDGAVAEPDSANLRMILRYPRPKKQIKIRYDIISRLGDENLNCPKEVFRPNLTEDFFYTHGLNLFFRHKDQQEKFEQRVTWGKRPAFPLFCLYNPGKGLAPYQGKSDEFQYTVILGNKNLVVDSLVIGNTTNYLVTAPGRNREFNNLQIRNYFEKYYKGMCRFWEEKDPPTYSLIIFPFQKIPFEATGLGLNHGFCARYNAYADTILTSNRIDLFSHEIGHNWISADFDNQWFGEGFNEMQTMYSIVATGVKPAESCVTYLNNALEKLHKSKIRNIPNDSIAMNFWNLGDYSWIPYWRGAVYAFRLLGQIEHHTGDIYAYRHLMLALKGHTTGMTPEIFLPVASRFMDEKVLKDEFQRFIMKGETITLDKLQMPSGCRLNHKPDGTPFIEISDMEQFKKHFILDEAAPKSAPHQDSARVAIREADRTPGTQWQGRKVAFLGDSMTDKRRIGTTCVYWEYLSELMGIEPFVYGINGNQWDGIYRQAEKLLAERGQDIDAIFIFAGTNDYNASLPLGEFFSYDDRTVNHKGNIVTRSHRTPIMDTGTFCGRINRVMLFLKEHYPTKQIILMTPIHRAFAQFGEKNVQPDESYCNGQHLFIDSYVDAIRKASSLWAVPLIDLHTLSGLYPLADSNAMYFHNADTDRLHPNAVGDYRLARTIQYQLLALPATF